MRWTEWGDVIWDIVYFCSSGRWQCVTDSLWSCLSPFEGVKVTAARGEGKVSVCERKKGAVGQTGKRITPNSCPCKCLNHFTYFPSQNMCFDHFQCQQLRICFYSSDSNFSYSSVTPEGMWASNRLHSPSCLLMHGRLYNITHTQGLLLKWRCMIC